MSTILLVDDEPAQLNSLRIRLLSNGYHTVEASDGPAALHQLCSLQISIDVVVTDYSMPGMSGIELLKRIRALPKSPPVILMTAYGEKTLLIEALRSRCDGYLEKPFAIEALIQEIKRITRSRLRDQDSHRMASLLPRLVHQINNPLSLIIGHAELGILNLHDSEKLQENLQSIVTAAASITAINKKIFQLGCSQAEQRNELDLVEVIQEALEFFGGLLAHKKIVVEAQFDEESPAICGLRNTLTQAFKNLVLNAIDAMEGKPLKVLKVQVAQVEEGSSILIRFEDTGCGIPGQNLQRVFDPYFTCKENGNGLGLTVVKEAIESHGGSIEIHSEVDLGTCFTIVLPSTAPVSTTRKEGGECLKSGVCPT